MSLESMREMHEEHEAWLEVVREWKRIFPLIDFNSQHVTPLVKSIEVWGERLVALRMKQDDVQRVIILQDKLNAYADARAER